MSDIVTDTSAAIAVLAGEPDGGGVAHLLGAADRRLMSAATTVELGIVLTGRFGPIGPGSSNVS